MEQLRYLNRYISIIQRMSNPYFDRKLSAYHIGCGQQFFLLHIFQNPGITFWELAAMGHYDKATATRAVQKLENGGYVRSEMDLADKRVRHIYITDKALPILEETRKTLDGWVDILTKGFEEEEIQQAQELLKRMSLNAREYTQRHKGEEF